MWPVTMQDMRKRKAGLEVKERHGQTCVPGALLVRVDTVQAALSLVPATRCPIATSVTCTHIQYLMPLRHPAGAFCRSAPCSSSRCVWQIVPVTSGVCGSTVLFWKEDKLFLSKSA